MKKVIVIVGPTASGKTAFSIRLAKEINTEIISGDSVQVYRGLDIGSGKIKEEEKEGIKHYLIDILSPKENYSVADFQKMARNIIDENDKAMIICGGTGLYIKACLYDYDFIEEKNDYDNSWLEEMDNEDLYKLLLEKDPLQAEKIHINNRKRLIRALEIIEHSSEKQSDIIVRQKHDLIYDAFIVGCTMDRDILYERINKRVDKMIEEGLEEEVKSLLNDDITFNYQSMQAIGYKEWKNYLEANQSKEEVIEEIKKHSRQFAKRQYTFFNNQMKVKWFNSDNEEEGINTIEEIKRWIG